MCVVKFLQVKVVKSDKAMGTVCDLRDFLDNSIMLLLVAVHVCWLHSVRTKTNWKQQLEIEYAIAHASLELFCVDGVEYCYFDSAFVLKAFKWYIVCFIVTEWTDYDNGLTNARQYACDDRPCDPYFSISLSLYSSLSLSWRRGKKTFKRKIKTYFLILFLAHNLYSFLSAVFIFIEISDQIIIRNFWCANNCEWPKKHTNSREKKNVNVCIILHFWFD